MEPIIEKYSMNEERRIRQQRRREEERRELLREIQHSSEHPLSRFYRSLDKHKRDLLEDEKEIMKREAELEEFQPTIKKMEKQPVPHYTIGSYLQSPAYERYKEYKNEKKRLEGNVEFYKRNMEDRKDRIRELELKIQELEESPGQHERGAQMRDRYLHDDEDIDTIDSANVFYKATKSHRRPYQDTRQRHESNPIPKLSNHGEGFRRKFASLVNSFQGQPDALERMGYPMKSGKRKTRKRKHK
jgi:hypothetical protein